MQEVVVELHGNVHIAVFDIVHTEAGRKARGGEPRSPDQSLIDHIRNELSPQAQGAALSRAYASALSAREGV